MRSRITILAVLAFVGSPLAASAADAVKTFPVSKCRYTLPGKDWTWVEPTPDPLCVCVARNRDGLTIMLMVLNAPPRAAIDTDFTVEFDEGAFASGAVRKQGGRITTFKGLPCYESEWVQRTGCCWASRVVLANGFGYQLQLVGDENPVEKRPDFEAIMDGFEFTSPPVPPVPYTRGEALAGKIGGLLPYVILWTCFILLWLGSRKK